MRIETIIREVYTFDELSEDAKQIAIEAYRNCTTYEPELLLDDIKTDLESKGFKDPQVMYTGFYSQGDGACFTCDFNFDLINETYKLITDTRLLALLNSGSLYISGSVKHSGHYYHEKSVHVNLDIETTNQYIENYTNIWAKLDCIEDDLQAVVQSECNEIYTSLQSEYEHLNSDEYIIECIQSIGYEYTKEGIEI